jgi:hypothetical protein
MKPAPFEYFAPDTMDEALRLLAEHADVAKVIAGGQSLGPLLNMRLARPDLLIDLNRLRELDYLRDDDGALVIGALTRQRAVERSRRVSADWPLLHEAVGYIGHPTIRNRGTVGGSVAHADPSAELPAVVTALEAELRIRGPRGERTRRAAGRGPFAAAPAADRVCLGRIRATTRRLRPGRRRGHHQPGSRRRLHQRTTRLHRRRAGALRRPSGSRAAGWPTTKQSGVQFGSGARRG